MPDWRADPEVIKGARLLEIARANYAINHPWPKAPAAINQVISNRARAHDLPEAPRPANAQRTAYLSNLTQPALNREYIKIYPLLAFAAIKSQQVGAWRAWTIAKHLDQPNGAGNITRRALITRLDELRVSKRQQRRWITAAYRLGLWQETHGVLYLVNLARAAYKLGASRVGRPAIIDQSAMISNNWRAYVWAGYLTTLHERPISQLKKYQLTGIDPRTQRNYQRQLAPGRRGNYAQTNLKPEQIDGMEETEGGHYFKGRDNQVIRKLPDTRIVSDTVSKAAPKGRSQKAQKALNCLSNEGQANEQFFRVFCESPKQAEAAERQIAHSNLYPWEKPRELYQLRYAGQNNNLYTTISMGSIL
jgi:hypothetical protein